MHSSSLALTLIHAHALSDADAPCRHRGLAREVSSNALLYLQALRPDLPLG
jgi:hypothetical protein